MSSKFREPFPWEDQEPRQLPEGFEASVPVALPDWGRPAAKVRHDTEHKNARYAMDNLARRHIEQARQNGVTNYTREDGLREARKAAHRFDKKRR